MLLADKDRVEYDNKQNLLTLQYSEMDYHLSRCLTLGLQSSHTLTHHIHSDSIRDTASRGIVRSSAVARDQG